MTRSEFRDYLRFNYPDYNDLSDDELIEKCSRLPKFAGWLTPLPVVVEPRRADYTVSDRIKKLKEKPDSSLFGFVEGWGIARTADNFELREKVASHVINLETLQGTAKKAAMATARAEIDFDLETVLKEAMTQHQAEIYQRATAMGVPFDAYRELIIEYSKSKFLIDLERQRTDLKLYELYEGDKQGVMLGRLRNDSNYAYMSQLAEQVGELEDEIRELQQLQPGSNVIVQKQRLLATYLKQYDERLKSLAVPADDGRKSRRPET